MRQEYSEDCFPILRDFLGYMEVVKGRSAGTVENYFADLRVFFRYIKQLRGLAPATMPEEEIPISDVDIDLIRSITLQDIYEYMSYAENERQNHDKALARKACSLRVFFRHLTNYTHQLDYNPVQNLDTPKVRKALPKYLTLEESTALLKAVDGPNKNRDFAILMLFLNCGIRRSELVGLNLTDVYEDRIRVVGKGNKERIVYMGSSCRRAIDRYLEERNNIVLTDNKALFGSRDKNRISVSAVHRLVKKHLLESGLDASQFSAHKLRHTAATLMLANGVDLKTLQEVLGHENLNTTQIYTHIENTDKKIAAEANPLSKLKI